jgi:hypothetical protein
VKPQLHLVRPPVDVKIQERVPPAAPAWWDATEFRALAEVRRAMGGGSVPSKPPENAEESARLAVFWALFEIEHILDQLRKRIEAGDSVRLRSGIYAYTTERVDFNLRIVEHVEITGAPR